VHEVEHVAGDVAGEAVEEAFGQVNTTTWPLVVVEGAVHLDLLARANRREAIMGKDATEIGAGFKLIKVNAWRLGH
jgi:hypothetical protein